MMNWQSDPLVPPLIHVWQVLLFTIISKKILNLFWGGRSRVRPTVCPSVACEVHPKPNIFYFLILYFQLLISFVSVIRWKISAHKEEVRKRREEKRREEKRENTAAAARLEKPTRLKLNKETEEIDLWRFCIWSYNTEKYLKVSQS